MTYALGAFRLTLSGKTLTIWRDADGSWAGETEVSRQTARELIRLAAAIDPGTRQETLFGEAAE